MRWGIAPHQVSSCPHVLRASTFGVPNDRCAWIDHVDGRNKSGHDEGEIHTALPNSSYADLIRVSQRDDHRFAQGMPGSGPGMTGDFD